MPSRESVTQAAARRFATEDPTVLAVLGQHRGIVTVQPQAVRLFPGRAEPDRLGELGVSEFADVQDLPPPFSTTRRRAAAESATYPAVPSDNAWQFGLMPSH